MKNRPTAKPRNRPTRRSAAAGFTLIEAALTMVIVGVGVLAMVSAQQAYHIKNGWAVRTGTAQMLANEIRELTLTLPHHDPITGSTNLGVESNETGGVADWDDLDDFAGTIDASGFGSGVTFNPPINGLRLTVADLGQWSQRVTVEKVWPDNVSTSTPQALSADSDFMRVTVDVLFQQDAGSPVDTATTMTWVVAQ